MRVQCRIEAQPRCPVLIHEQLEILNLFTFFYAMIPPRLDYIDTTTRKAVSFDLKCKAGVAEEQYE
jgi:hypothetical protein